MVISNTSSSAPFIMPSGTIVTDDINLGHQYELDVGCVAGDEESYDVFQELFDQVIEARHNGYKKTDKHKTDRNLENLKGGDKLDEKYVLSTQVRCSRSVRGLCLPPHCSRAERRKVETIVREALAKVDGESRGKYVSLLNITDAEKSSLVSENLLFNKPTCGTLLSTHSARDWPDARGIWYNGKKNFLAWVNEKDHLQIISRETGGNLREAFGRLCDGLEQIEEHVKSDGWEFMWNEHLGYIVSCPGDLGTSFRAVVDVKIPLLSQHPRFDMLMKKLRLTKETPGEKRAEEGRVSIYNAGGLGFSEIELTQTVIDGIQVIVSLEQRLEAGEKIESDIEKMKQK